MYAYLQRKSTSVPHAIASEPLNVDRSTSLIIDQTRITYHQDEKRQENHSENIKKCLNEKGRLNCVTSTEATIVF